MAASQQSWSGSENDAKIRFFLGIYIISEGKRIKNSFHKACETTF